jgi:hypothetical protein
MSRDERDHPLISERSPSYARARHEHAHPTPTADPEEIAVLNRLVEAEDHAAAVCAAASNALGSALGQAPGAAPGARVQAEIVAELGALHEGQVHALARVIAELGAAAPQPGQRERVLGRDPADIHYLQDAAAILQAVDATEDELYARYADALARPGMPAAAQAVLARHGEAQREHRAHLTALMRDTRF